MKLSVIICTRDDSKWEAVRAHYSLLLARVDHEIIRMPNDGTPIAARYNRGFKQSKGELIIFSHDDVEFLNPATFAPRLIDHMKESACVGIAGTNRLVGPGWVNAGLGFIFGHVANPQDDGFSVCVFGPQRLGDVQALDGLFMCCRREVAEKVAWDGQTFDGWHGADIDWSYRVHLAGFSMSVVTDLHCLHASRGDFGEAWAYAGRKLMKKFGNKIQLMPQRASQFAWVVVPTVEDVLAVMTATA